MKIDVVFPSALEQHNGIADHTWILARELIDRGHSVRVLHGPTARASSPDLIPGPELVPAWLDSNLRDTTTLRRVIAQGDADLVVLQFEQFSFGRRGYNPELSRLFRDLRTSSAPPRLVLMAHESYPDPGRPGRTAMWAYQRAQIRRLATDADGVIASCHAVARRLRNTNSLVAPVPVFSNVPTQLMDRAAARLMVGVEGDELSVLVFGNLHGMRLRFVSAAVREMAASMKIHLLYAGRASENELVGEVGDLVRVSQFRHASVETVSNLMNAADLALAPFPDGVSGRRGSFTALLRHGVPTLTNVGIYTDDYLHALAAAGAFSLVQTSERAFTDSGRNLACDSQLRARIRGVLNEVQGDLPTPERVARVLEQVATAGRK